MHLLTLQRRSLRHYWRGHVAVALGAAVAAAVLTGALLVGDSLRGSLRAAALERLGGVTHAVQSSSFLREQLAADLDASLSPSLSAPDNTALPPSSPPQKCSAGPPCPARLPFGSKNVGHGGPTLRVSGPRGVLRRTAREGAGGGSDRRPSDLHPAPLPSERGLPSGQFVPLILLRGTASNPATHASASGVQVLGVDERFGITGVALNAALAEDIGLRAGDDVLIRVGKPAVHSPEMLFGRRDETTLTLRLTVDHIVPLHGLGLFSLTPGQTTPRNAYVPLATLQRALGRPGRVNTLLVRTSDTGRDETALVQALCQSSATLADYGLKLRTSETHDYVALESDAFLLVPPVESAARAAAEALGAAPTAILAYLANTIASGFDHEPRAAIPYSVVAAWQPDTACESIRPLKEGTGSAPAGYRGSAASFSRGARTPLQRTPMTLVDGDPAPSLGPGEILLNEWAAAELAPLGDNVTLSYYVTDAPGQLHTESAGFRLRGVVRLAGPAADAGFTPEYPGLTDARSLSDWRPPFPIDLRRIRPQDEVYWDEHKATPKAFVSLADGQRLWVRDPERFGRLTALRVSPAALRDRFEAELLSQLDAAQLGLRVQDVRARALAAGEGATDFGGLFLGFSLFLIVSAALLVALLFKLGVERRGHEAGFMLAAGFSRARVARVLLGEAGIVAVLGVCAGLLAARGYAALMLAGLRHAWGPTFASGALGTHAAFSSYLVGGGASLLCAALAILWALRSTLRPSPRALLARVGTEHGTSLARRMPRWLTALAGVSGIAGVAFPLLAPTTETAGSAASLFFAGGGCLLLAGLAVFALWLAAERRAAMRPHGTLSWRRVAVRSARRAPGRSLLTVALIACATFVIAALQAFRVDVRRDAGLRAAGTGGFELLAESDAPLLNDPDAPADEAGLALSDAAERGLADVRLIGFRVHDGDDASCLNLYRPTQPRVLGVPEIMTRRGGFVFAGSLARTDEQRRNPWLLLHVPPADDVIPAIADEAAARWQMHVGLGDELSVTDERGRAARLRLVALLRGSVLQGAVLIGEPSFMRLFPSVAGYRYFLIDAPPEHTTEIAATLSRELSDYGLAVTPAVRRLGELLGVQDVYLSAFQALGGLGLLLGTVGLAAVMLRNVWERRSELALLRAVGFSRFRLAGMVLSENIFLAAVGLVLGLLCAAWVDLPHLTARASQVPWASLMMMTGVILLAAVLAGAAALYATLRAPLLPALRAE